jgi:beta-carotene 3-hydroxylase
VTLLAVGVVAFLVSEPLAAFAHRALMHGSAWRLHRSHHRRRRGAFEANDLFPVVFAAVTIAVMAAGDAAGRPGLLAAGAGVTAYGLLYALVHDVCIHGRLTGGRPVLPGRWLRWVASCHAVHHRDGRAPYGFLVPIVPARHRAAVSAFRGVDTLARVENTS